MSNCSCCQQPVHIQQFNRFCGSQGYPELDRLRASQYEWLLQTGQQNEAGEVKERQGDFHGAIQHYLKAGLPTKAAHVAISRSEIINSSETVEAIAASLIKGEFYERVSWSEKSQTRTVSSWSSRTTIPDPGNQLLSREFRRTGRVEVLDQNWKYNPRTEVLSLL